MPNGHCIEQFTKEKTLSNLKNINVIVENHGGLSSDAAKVTARIEEINLPNYAILPDFGNFFIKREDKKRWGGKCIEKYDLYNGVKELMPYAKDVSAKSYNFDSLGNETTIDYYKMIQIIKKSGYNGYIGVEYEGSNLSEEKGILATKKLLMNAIKR